MTLEIVRISWLILPVLTDTFLSRPYIVNIFWYISNKMQRYTVYLFLETALHVSGGISTNHQEHIQLYLQHLVLVKPLLLPAGVVKKLELQLQFQLLHVAVTVWQVPDAVNTVECAPDDGWRYHPQHVEQFPEINKLCNFASCWIYIRINKFLYRATSITVYLLIRFIFHSLIRSLINTTNKTPFKCFGVFLHPNQHITPSTHHLHAALVPTTSLHPTSFRTDQKTLTFRHRASSI